MSRFFVLTVFLLSALPATAALRIYHIDVEQGDATLMVSPTGETMLVDGGKNGHGERLKAAMARLGVTQIDNLVVTHYHEDHYGGVDELVGAPNPVTVVNVYDRGDKAFLPASKTSQQTYIDYQNELGHRATHIMRGESIIALAGQIWGKPAEATMFRCGLGSLRTRRLQGLCSDRFDQLQPGPLDCRVEAFW